MRGTREAGGFRVACAAAAAWLGAYATWLALAPGGEHAKLVFSDTAYLVPIALATLAAVLAARSTSGHSRVFWGLVAASSASWLVGEILWAARELTIGEVPFPWWSDVAFVPWYVLVGAAICFAYRPSLRTVRLAGIVDGLIVVATLSVFWWWVVLRQLAVGTDLASVVAIAYPSLDLVLLGLLVATRLLPSRRGSRAGALVTAAVVVGALADTLYTALALRGDYMSGGWLDLAWQLQALLLGLAAVAALSGVDRGGEWAGLRSPVRLGTGTIMTFALTVLVTVLGVGGLGGGLDAASLGAACGLALLLILRGWLVLRAARDNGLRDPTTGVYDGGYLADQLRRHVARAQTFGEGFALVVLDAPTEGEAERRLAAAARDVEIVGRLSDDGLAALVPLLTADDARQRAEELRRACGDDVCAGVSVWEPELDADDLLRHARALLAAAHRLGRNHVRGPAPDLLLESTELTSDVARQLFELVGVVDRREGVEGHSRTVARLARRIAVKLDLPPDLVSESWLGGLLHDVGKLSMPEELLRSSVPLSGVDRDLVARHTANGARLVKRIPTVRHVAHVIRALHEHVDGSGHPAGLAMSEIPAAARVIAVAERLVSMTADRPHRAAAGLTSTLSEIWRFAGSRYEPLVVSALFALVKDGEVRLEPSRPGSPPVFEVDGATV